MAPRCTLMHLNTSRPETREISGATVKRRSVTSGVNNNPKNPIDTAILNFYNFILHITELGNCQLHLFESCWISYGVVRIIEKIIVEL
ncbi:hypothetical protein PUN28_003881 [Cardiocondyla obscurior]|uniref:Uncharacterized protein n=1 Tax=Cardiocondyla obscurior TaxID=286306 RepID=A0AAW2GMM2_9HYME